MPFADDHLKEEIRNRLDIAEVVGRYVKLRPAGRNLKGLCPFHKEKTPSFTVNPERNIYHCFGCSRGGDVFSFLMEIEGLGFAEVLKLTAEEIGVDLGKAPIRSNEQTSGLSRTDLLKIHEQATQFYYSCMRDSSEAIAYFKNRGLTGETVRDFRLGYAPAAWDALSSFARLRGIKDEALEACGLAIKRDSGGYYDRFRDRVMFPIMDLSGRPIAFGGRGMQADATPKYLNSPETALYRKNRTLYGLHAARGAIKELGQVLCVEGYMDVLSLVQAGVRNCVATSGTALTPEHGQLLRRFTARVVLVFDGDRAGIAAAERAVTVLAPLELHIRVLLLPQGEDPDTYIQKYGREKFLDMVEQARDGVEFVLLRASERHGTDTPHGKAAIIKEMTPLLQSMGNAVVIDEYVRAVAYRLGVDERLVRQQVTPQRQRPVQEVVAPEQQRKMVESFLKTEVGSFLHILARHEELLALVAERVQPETLTDPFSRELYCLLLRTRAEARSLDAVVGEVTEGQMREVLTSMLVQAPPTENAEQDVKHKARQILHTSLIKQRRAVTQRLRSENDPQARIALLQRQKDLTCQLGAISSEW